LYQLKSQFQDQLRPISDTLAGQGVTANQVTVSAVLLSVGTAYVIAKPAAKNQALWLLMPSSLCVRMALNAIDGMMAREHGQASKLGAVLNELGDIVADTALLASLLPHIDNQETPVGLINIAENLSHSQRHIVGLIGFSIGTELLGIASNTALGTRANHGPLGKSDRAFLLGVLGILVGVKVPLSLSPIRIGQLCLLTEAMLLKTCLNRLCYMANLYVMRKPPVPKSTLNALSDCNHSNISNHVEFSPSVIDSFIAHNALPHSSTNASLLESNIMSATSNNAENKINLLNDSNHKDPSQKTSSKQPSSKQSSPKTIHGESSYNAYDGTAIYYRYWLTMPLEAIKQASQQHTQHRQVILLHRGHEHSGRLEELGQQFAVAGYQVFAWDARGNGRSGGIKDHAESVTEL